MRMSELVSVVVTILAYTFVLAVKPEWFLGWLVKLLEKKLPLKKANESTNALGIKLAEAGRYLIVAIPDDEEINTLLNKFSEILQELKKKLFPLS
jgi:hypothetical protein